ncbi:PREDICTED: DNA polymerase eta isoform X2 [Nelumbo nucifera]|nr:PREDICTED: DNA polymerase eta isoform X2 [Nelumbo nucifera]
MRGDEAKKVCPQIHLVQVPVARNKADLNLYRNAGSEVVSILARKGRCERASIDEVYLDITDAAETMLSENPPEILESIDDEVLKSHILGINEDRSKGENVREWLCRSDADRRDKLLACGAIIVADLRMQVLKETEFTCSAGIAHNKMLAKLASAMNKPAQQTVVPFSSVKGLLATLPIKKMKQLGGKLGASLQSDLGANTVGDLLQFTEEMLQERYGINTGTWLWNIARGISGDEVQGRLLPKSHGCGKTFPSQQALRKITSVERWLNDLCEELSERIQSDLDQNRRIAQTLTLHARVYKTNDSDLHKKFPSKSCPLRYGTVKIQEDALKLFESGLREFFGSQRVEIQGNQKNGWGVTALSVSASKILDIPPGTCSILRFFQGCESSSSSPKEAGNENIQENVPPFSPSGSESSLGQNQAKPQKGSRREESGINCAKLVLNCEQTRESQDYKGKGSILRFFKVSNSSCSSSKQVDDGTTQAPLWMTPSGTKNCLGSNQAQELKVSSQDDTGNNSGRPSLVKDLQRRPTWNYNIDEIDPSVIDELPPEIQQEIRGWLHPPKRASTAKHGSSIAHYFLPTKKA